MKHDLYFLPRPRKLIPLNGGGSCQGSIEVYSIGSSTISLSSLLIVSTSLNVDSGPLAEMYLGNQNAFDNDQFENFQL